MSQAMNLVIGVGLGATAGYVVNGTDVFGDLEEDSPRKTTVNVGQYAVPAAMTYFFASGTRVERIMAGAASAGSSYLVGTLAEKIAASE